MTLWSGRVSEGMAPEVWSYLLAEDAELLPYDLEGTRLHARRLRAAGLLDDAELEEAERILQTISPADRLPDDEDVHSVIERLLGDVGRKIHAGRSRNDQVAAALRLYVEDCVPGGRRRAAGARTRRARARRGRGRDADARLHAPAACAAGHGRPPPAGVGGDARARPRTVPSTRGPAAPSPLGVGGARRLHARAASTPDRQLRNSLDAVSDRDFALDYLYACAVFHSHPSRIGEELCFWSTPSSASSSCPSRPPPARR